MPRSGIQDLSILMQSIVTGHQKGVYLTMVQFAEKKLDLYIYIFIVLQGTLIISKKIRPVQGGGVAHKIYRF